MKTPPKQAATLNLTDPETIAEIAGSEGGRAILGIDDDVDPEVANRDAEELDPGSGQSLPA